MTARDRIRGCLLAGAAGDERHRARALGPPRAYVRRPATQGEAPLPEVGDGWLVHVEGLRHRRAPGNTCLAALRDDDRLDAFLARYPGY